MDVHNWPQIHPEERCYGIPLPPATFCFGKCTPRYFQNTEHTGSQVCQDWYLSKYNIITRNCLQSYNNLKTINQYPNLMYLSLPWKDRITFVVCSLIQPPCCSPREERTNYECALLCRQNMVCLHLTPHSPFILVLNWPNYWAVLWELVCMVHWLCFYHVTYAITVYICNLIYTLQHSYLACLAKWLGFRLRTKWLLAGVTLKTFDFVSYF